MIFAEKVRAARKALNYSQKALADESGISQRSIQNYESGARVPKNSETYRMLANALRVTQECLKDNSAEIDYVCGGGEAQASRAKKLASELRQIILGGRLSNEDTDEILISLNSAYWQRKKRGAI